MEAIDVSQTIIAVCDLKVGRYIQLIELMKVYKYSMSRPLFLLWPKVIYISELKLAFLRNHWAIIIQLLYVSFQLQ